MPAAAGGNPAGVAPRQPGVGKPAHPQRDQISLSALAYSEKPPVNGSPVCSESIPWSRSISSGAIV